MFKFSYSHIRNTNQDFIISIYKLFISFETYSLSIFAKFTFFHTMGGGAIHLLGPENSPETKDFTDPWGGLNPHAPPYMALIPVPVHVLLHQRS